MAKYVTRQRKILLDFLNLHSDETLSAGQIYETLKDKKISESAIYRNLLSLQKDGEIIKVSRAGTETLYRFAGEHEHCKNSIHLSCKKCGKMFHLNDEKAAALINGLESSQGFSVDKANTVLYGICGECK